MNHNLLYDTRYRDMPESEKETLLLELGELYGFTFKEYRRFSKWGLSLFTAIYEYDNSEFVFIPGSRGVKLGWSRRRAIGRNALEYFNSAVSDNDFGGSGEYDYIYDFIDTHTSYERTVHISPMFAERRSASAIWAYSERISSKDIADSSVYFKIYREISKTAKTFIIKSGNNKTKYCITDSGIDVYKYGGTDINDILFNAVAEGFSVPDENEWEYMCSGGTQSLFPWGDMPDKQDGTPNFFGLFIGFGCGFVEMVSDKKNIYKGGCAGRLEFAGNDRLRAISYSPYFESGYDSDREYDIRFRRIIRISAENTRGRVPDEKNINEFIESNFLSYNFEKVIYAVNNIKNPDISYENILLLIRSYQNKGFFRKSLEWIDKIKLEGANDYDYNYSAGVTYTRLGMRKDASIVLNNAVRLKRNSPECWRMLAGLYKYERKEKEFEYALYNLKKSDPESIGEIKALKSSEGLKTEDEDYGALWETLYNKIKNNAANKFFLNGIDKEIIYLGRAVNSIRTGGFKEYIADKNYENCDFIKHILKEIEESPFIRDTFYLNEALINRAFEYFYACKNIFAEIYETRFTATDKELQILTNGFFDYSSGLEAFAYIHYSNKRLFEADTLFDESYILCAQLFADAGFKNEAAEKIKNILQSFISYITVNICDYAELASLCRGVMRETVAVTASYGNALKNKRVSAEISVRKDMKYILKWFGIDININEAVRKSG